MEEVRQTESTWNKDRAFALSRSLWRDFGPLIVGAVVLIVVLVGGWSLFKKSASLPNETVIDQQASSDITLPESTINLGSSPQPIGGTSPSASSGPAATPTPTPTAKPSPTPVAVAKVETKGGQLPKTGPEVLYSLASLVSVAGGYLLHKKAKKFI